MVDTTEVLEAATLIVEAVALNEALLEGDLTEARFRAGFISSRSPAAGYERVQHAATHLVQVLGEPGERPQPGYGAAVLELSRALEGAASFLRR